jgi:glycosyltransferase involved in cell wall biosynthesis
MLILRTPPPFGGGEILGAALGNYLKTNPEFVVLESNSEKRNKGNQGSFSWWKVKEFFLLWFKFIVLIIHQKPLMVFAPLAKSFPHFVRDSLFFWTAWIFRIPFTGELAGATFYFLGNNKWQTYYGKMVLSRLACLRVLGNQIAMHLQGFGIKNTIVSDNGIDSSGSPYYAKQTSNKNTFQILFVGTLSQQKGFSTLVDACCHLADQGLVFEIHAMGEWVSEKYGLAIENILDRRRTKNRFVFHGLTHGSEKSDVFLNSDMLVLPSYVEGQPLVILEALSFGLPVVATKVGGIPDTIEDGKHGFLINPGDSNELAEKIKLLMETPDLCETMSEENVKLYRARYTQKAFLRTQTYWLKQVARGDLKPHGQFIQAPE